MASEVKVFRGGQSCETWLSFPNILSNSLKEYWTFSPLAIFLRSVTNEVSLSCGRDHVKSTVLNQMPRTSPTCEQSKAFLQDGSLSAAFMLSACRVSLYCSTKLLSGAFVSKGTTDGISSTVLPCATGGKWETG